MISSRTKTVVISAGAGSVSFGIPTARFAGAYFQFDFDHTTTATVVASALGRDIATWTGVSHDKLEEYTPATEPLVASPLGFGFSSVTHDGTAELTIYLDPGN